MTVDTVIIGAGAAGLGAAKTAEKLGLKYLVLEASHRIGGRAYTEPLTPGICFDLGCHWLHCASRNPFTQLLDVYGMQVGPWVWHTHFFKQRRWLDVADDFIKFESIVYESMLELARQGRDIPIAEVYDRDQEWTRLYDYVISLLFSVDPDQVSIRDFTDFEHTGEATSPNFMATAHGAYISGIRAVQHVAASLDVSSCKKPDAEKLSWLLIKEQVQSLSSSVDQII